MSKLNQLYPFTELHNNNNGSSIREETLSIEEPEHDAEQEEVLVNSNICTIQDDNTS